MIADKLPELVRTQVEAIKNLKIDKITVWDSMGGGGNGDKTPTSANFLSGMLKSIPPFNEIFKMAGMELPSYLKGDAEDVKSEDVTDKKDEPVENTESTDKEESSGK